MAFEHIGVHTIGSLHQQSPEPTTEWIIYRVSKQKRIVTHRIDKVVWDSGYFWGEYEGKRIMPSMRPEELVHVFR